ncbi:hypothetical protein GCM10027592_53330 [Spirosoma flavus]
MKTKLLLFLLLVTIRQIVLAQAPTISSFSPTSGGINTQVTLYGSNFTGTTSVRFGEISAPFTVVSSTQLNVTVPRVASTQIINVTNASGYGLSSSAFTVTRASNLLTFNLIANNFAGVNVSSNAAPAVADIDGDGLLDLLVGRADGTVMRYEQTTPNGTAFTNLGTLKTSSNVNIDSGTESTVSIVDLEGNGRFNLILGRGDGTVDEYKQTGVGAPTFNLVTNNFAGISTDANTVPSMTDLNGNGLLEIILGKGDGIISHSEQNFIYNTDDFYRINTNFNDLQLSGNDAPFCVDIDGNGRIDILVGVNTGNIYRFEQSDVGSFNVNQLTSNFNSINAGANAKPCVTDIDGDGLLDLLVGRGDGTIDRYEQAGIGNTAPTDITLNPSSVAENVAAGTTVGTLTSTDAQGGSFTYALADGTNYPDNASFSISGNSLSITSSPNFEAKNSYSIKIRTTDGGGLTFDKVLTITITNVTETPTVTSFSPTSGLAGTSVSINGSHFNDAGNVTVRFNGVPATTVNVLSNSQLTAIVPNGAATGTISVQNADGTGTSTNSFTITPQVSSVGVPANSTYGIGAVLNFRVVFDQPVTVTGTPTIPLTVGSTARTASYVSGSGSTTLVFAYTVVSGDLDNNGVTLGSAISLNGGTIRNNTINANLSLNNVASTNGVLVDGVAPTVSITSSASNPTSTSPITVSITFSESVTNFIVGDISVSNGTKGTLSGSGANYTLPITPSGTGTVTISVSVAANVATDGAGNGNTASNAFTITYSPPPTITGFATLDNTICVGSPITFTATIGNVTGSYNYTLTNGSGTSLSATTSGSTFSQSLTAAGSGSQTFTLRVIGNSQLATATTNVTVNSLPGAGLLNNGPLTCAQASVTLTASGGTSYTFVNSSGTVLGTSGATTTRVVTSPGTYSVTVANSAGCISTTSTTVSSNTTAPTATIQTPASTTLTCNTTSISLTATGGGTYRWDDNTATTIRSVTTGGTYSVTVTAPNGCTNSASVQVFQNNSAPTVNITPSSATLTCANVSTTLTANGTGTYRWSTGANTPTISVSLANTYSVTLTGANGCSSTATAQIFLNNTTPMVSISPSSATLTCASPAVSLSAMGTGSYRWNTGETTPVISVNTANTYSVRLTGANGCTAVASAQISQDTNVPAVSITPASATLTCTTPTVSLSALGSGTYRWNTGATTSTVSATAAGTYSVTLTGTNGCSSTATAQVIQDNSLPTLSINPSSATLTCANLSITLTANGTGTYRWNTGATTQSISVNTANTYSVTLTGANGCSSTATAQVFQDNSAPTVSITPSSATLTCANSTVTLTANGVGTYRWNTGATSQTISVGTANTYSVTLTASNGCTATATAQVDQDSNVPTVSINPSIGTPTGATLTCATSSVSLSAVGSGSFRWNTGATTSVISATSAATYSVTLTGSNGCTATASIQIFQDNSQPTVSITPSSATLTCATPTVSLSAVGNGTYRWSTGATTASISATSAATYSVTLTASNGCTATASAQVIQDDSAPSASINPTSATLTCANSSAILTANGTGTYHWNTGAISQTISVGTSGTYSVTVTAANGCSATATALVSQENSVPTVSINPASATLSCANPVVSLSAVGTGTYRWNTGEVTSSISATTAGTYSVTLTATNGCTAIASAQVVQNANLPSVSISPSTGSPAGVTLSCASSTVTLTANGTGTYRWNTGATSQTISVGAAGTYSLTVTAANGCSATASIQVYQDNSLPTLNITPSSATLTCTTPAVSLNANGSGTYRWNTGAVTSSISVTAAGTYSVTLTGTNGCSAVASAQVVQDNALPAVSISANPSLTITNGQSATLTASGATTYQWSTGINGNSIVVNNAGTYSVTGTVGNCSGQASVTVSQGSQPTGTFGIAAVTTNTCSQIAANRYVVSFTPQYDGLSGQPVSVSVVNEMFPTTAPGPYTLQLYTDNPTIIIKAQQAGTAGEISFAYNWLTNCSNPQLNTPPRVNQPIGDQVARVGEGFGYTIPQTTFTDNETPQSLVLSVTGLPVGLSFTPPAQIGGVPAVSGVSSVTVTATDPQGLAVSTSFRLTVVEQTATNTPPTLVNPVSNQVAIVQQPYSLNLATTFTDAQTPNALTLTASGLPAGLMLTGTTLSGTPLQTGTSTVTLTAADPGGLTTSTSFAFTVQPTSVTATGTFAITGVNPITCTQVANNRYAISFMPQYAGVNGQTISFQVVNEMAPTTAPGPYSLQLYNDNPTIVLKAKQDGSAGESSYNYNWLASCSSPQPNTPPRVNQPLANQEAKVGEGFGYTIPQLTFTDNESPQSLVLSVSGLPAGLSFSPPTQIGGVPSVTGVSTVIVTATDPQGLSVSTSFLLTVNPANTTNGFAITGVQTLSCVSIGANKRAVTFTPQYSGLTGDPISFSVVNELLPTIAAGPYQLELYTDNSALELRAQQGNGAASYTYNWLAACTVAGRQGVEESGKTMQVRVLGNPIEGDWVRVQVSNVEGQKVDLNLVNQQGQVVGKHQIVEAGHTDIVDLPIRGQSGILILSVQTKQDRQQLKVIIR